LTNPSGDRTADTLASIDHALSAHEAGGTFDDSLSQDAMRWTTEPTHGLPETQRARRGHDFYPPTGAAIPALYDTDGQPFAAKMLHLHYFLGGCDWWLAEYDPDSGTGFGYACLADPHNAEWGYLSLPELEAVRVQRGLGLVERDLGWTPTRADQADLPGWTRASR
jgi:Protein of unknown function (DUF2958)